MQKTFNPKYNFYQLTPAIFLVEVDGNNDLGHTFLRVQEFYESVNDNIRGQKFTIDEYKQWYCTQSKTGEFTYGEDWRGFNVPSHVIDNCYNLNTERTAEDLFLLELCATAKQLAKNSGFDSYYLLGVRKGDTTTLDHEIAHGLFTTNPTYRKVMSDAVDSIPTEVITPLYEDLTKLGYGPNVLADEAQAYLSTGLRKTQETAKLIALTTKFIDIFKSFLGDWKMPKPFHTGI